MIVILGNPAPQHAVGRDENDRPIHEALPSDRYEGDETVTVVGPFPEGTKLLTAVSDVVAPQGAWWNHTVGDDTIPTFVSSDNPRLAEFLGEHFGCPVRKMPRAELRAHQRAQESIIASRNAGDGLPSQTSSDSGSDDSGSED